MTKTIYFDMDGTITNFYGVENWLEYLKNENSLPYKIAEPLINMNSLARIINNLQRKGFQIGIISWLPKTSTTEFGKRVISAKEKWLKKHLNSIQWNEIHIVKYGTPKQEVAQDKNGILFDDEEYNRTNWKGTAYDVNSIIEILKSIKV